ncbi:hypothetical protein DMUE_5133 [Dictyocoela muelleri]|nr:hypothetical protein DMUE_5133 [Dictyocoela muelleri]
MDSHSVNLTDLLKSLYKLFLKLSLSEGQIYLYLLFSIIIFFVGYNMCKISLALLLSTYVILISSIIESLFENLKLIFTENCGMLFEIIRDYLKNKITIPFNIPYNLFENTSPKINLIIKLAFLLGSCYFISVMMIEFIPFIIYIFLLYFIIQIYPQIDYIIVFTGLIVFFLLKIFLKFIKKPFFIVLFSISSSLNICFSLQYISDNHIIPDIIFYYKKISELYIKYLEALKDKNIGFNIRFLLLLIGISFYLQYSMKIPKL